MVLPYLQWTLLGILAVGLPSRVASQQSSVVCLPQFGWMVNSKSQNPCLVGAYVQQVCVNGQQWTVPPLLSGQSYTAPPAAFGNPCECSFVTYNLMAACAVCQNATYLPWSAWTVNCSKVYPGYPEPIPIGTAIPLWAYQDLTTSDNFNVSLAQSVGDAPESTPTSTQTIATSLPSAAASALLTTLPSGTSLPATSKSPNVGVIAGGVVGGVVVVGAIAALATWFFIRRRRRRRTPPTVQPMNQWGQLDGVEPLTLRLYDPSDPSTFPTHLPLPSDTSFPATTGNNVTRCNGVPEL